MLDGVQIDEGMGCEGDPSVIGQHRADATSLNEAGEAKSETPLQTVSRAKSRELASSIRDFRDSPL
jgi:hypothetical protein